MKLSEYVTQVINDPKHGHDPEWVRLNLRREHLERIEAAHHAEVRAGVEAEEPEWAEEWIAYGRGVSEEFMIPESKGPNYATHQRTVKAGPWVPVEREGAR